MTPERWQQVQTLLGAALDRPADERAGFVAQACANDSDLRREVESLLAQDAASPGFLSRPPAQTPDPTTAAEPTLVGRIISGRYKIRSRIGQGGMGEVYLADDQQLRCSVAIKAPREPDKLLPEARAAAALRGHPHIAAIYDVLDARDGDTPPLIVMEYVDGETLSDRLAKGPLPVGDALRFGRDIADALVAADRIGIVHRDLKPANLRVSHQGRIKVLDFGLAYRMPPVAGTTTMTVERAIQTIAAHHIAGTPGYMSPEQVLGRPVDRSTDVFSLGVVLFEMLTGRRPFPGHDLVSYGIAMMTVQPPRVSDTVPDISADLDALIDRMLARESSLRPSAATVLEQLDALRTPSPPSSERAVRIGTAVVAFPAWTRLVIPAGAVLILAIAAFAARDPLRRRFGFVPSGPPPRISLALMPVEAPGDDTRADIAGASVLAVVGGNFGSIPRVTVLSRAATASYQKDKDDYAALGRALAATHVLKLSWRSTDPVTIEAQLLRPGVPQPESDQTFTGDVPSIERDTLNMLARTFEKNEPYRRFTSEEWDRLLRLPTSNGAALMAHAEARALLDRPMPDFDRVIALLQQATGLDPQFVYAWATLGDAWWNKYQKDKDPADVTRAQAALNKAIALDPDSPLSHYSLGDMYFRTGQFAQAEASFRRALQLQPDFDAAQRGLAQVLAGTGRVDEAEGLLRDAVRFSGNWNNFFMLGTIDYRAGRYAAAAEAFEQATRATPNSAGAFTMLGNSHYILGDVQQAIGNFEHAARLGPSPAAHANLALAYYDAGRFDDAVRAYQQSLETDPKNALNHKNIGDVYARMGRAKQAFAEYEQAIALGNNMLAVNPRDVRTIALVALCEAKLGRRADAERHAAEAVALDSTSRDAWQRSAEVHALLNQPDAALRDLAVAVARGFDPRMARKDEALASITLFPRFKEILSSPPGDPTQPKGARP